MGYPPILPGGPSYRSGEDPEREKRLAWLSRDYAGSPWLTALVQFSGFLLVFVGSFVAVILLINLGSHGEWWPYALILAALAAAHAALRMLRHHRRELSGRATLPVALRGSRVLPAPASAGSPYVGTPARTLVA